MDYNTLKTFWDTLETVGIEIPAIQRDYAQGREVGRVPVIRKKFISSLISALGNSNKLRLDFVYGKIYGEKNQEEIRKNTAAINTLLSSIKDYADSIDLIIPAVNIKQKSNEKGETVYLVPLDGQQRLTALFLIHWYLIKRLDLDNELKVLSRFRYKTRKSTELFIDMLCNADFKIQFESDSEKKSKKSLSDELINHEHFSNTWLTDPTVKSMLVVLDEINNCFVEKEITDYKLYWENLIENKIIYFDFLNLKNFSLSDDLYVKMNARGKSLSDFENFKAWLFGKIENEEWISSEKWLEDSKSFDILWNDVFWSKKAKNVYEVDEAYFNFFKLQYLINLVKEADLNKSAFKDTPTNDIIDSIIVNEPYFDFEKNYDDRFRDNLETYFKILDVSAKNEVLNSQDKEIIDYYNFFFRAPERNDTGSKNIEWIDLIENYIVLSYLQWNVDDSFKQDHFKDYYRVLSNLFNNQTFDNASLYQRALNDITRINENLVEKKYTISEWLLSSDLETKGWVFTEDQLSEEIKKQRWINADFSWMELFKEAERNPYFKGKIGFLLDWSNQDQDVFKINFEKIDSIFKGDVLNHNEHLVQRALLTFGNYFVDKGSNKVSYCKNIHSNYRDRRENWLGVLNDPLTNKIVMSLLDSDLFDYKNIEDSLLKIIEDWKSKNPLESKEITELDYWSFYIYLPMLFDYGRSSFIQLDWNKMFAFQLNATSTGGYFRDVILEFIKYYYYSDNEEIEVTDVKGWDNSPELKINTKISLCLERDEGYYKNRLEEDHKEYKTIKELKGLIESSLTTLH